MNVRKSGGGHLCIEPWAAVGGSGWTGGGEIRARPERLLFLFFERGRSWSATRDKKVSEVSEFVSLVLGRRRMLVLNRHLVFMARVVPTLSCFFSSPPLLVFSAQCSREGRGGGGGGLVSWAGRVKSCKSLSKMLLNEVRAASGSRGEIMRFA